MADLIASERTTTAPPSVVHDLLTDIAAWRLWAPHVAGAVPAAGHVAAGDVVRVRAWFSPLATPMRVTRARPGEGIDWESRALGHVLRYQQRIAPGPSGGAHVSFRAWVEGPAGSWLTRAARPLSALGQRRRLRRLAALAEAVAARAGQAPRTAAR
jgi:Polyketide cyclase / dehydrase and lipid transport